MLKKMADAIEHERGKAIVECMQDALSIYTWKSLGNRYNREMKMNGNK